MSHVFLSHVEEDFDVVLEIARGLEQAGYQTWYYERDCAAGASYLLQTREGIMQAQAVIVIISTRSLASIQVGKEVVRAHEGHKAIIPLLRDVTDAQYKQTQPEWEEAIGAATSLAIPPEGVASVMPRILRGLKILGVKPTEKGKKGTAQTVEASPATSTHSPVSAAPSTEPAKPRLPVRIVVAAIIAAIGFFSGVSNVFHALNPAPGSTDQIVFNMFPLVRTANLIANGLNFPLNALIGFGCWLGFQTRPLGFRLVRGASGAIMGIVILWVLVVVMAGVTSPYWSQMPASDKMGYIGGTFFIGLLAILMAGLVFYLFRKGK